MIAFVQRIEDGTNERNERRRATRSMPKKVLALLKLKSRSRFKCSNSKTWRNIYRAGQDRAQQKSQSPHVFHPPPSL